MNSFVQGFIKRAQEYGLSEGQAVDLIKIGFGGIAGAVGGGGDYVLDALRNFEDKLEGGKPPAQGYYIDNMLRKINQREMDWKSKPYDQIGTVNPLGGSGVIAHRGPSPMEQLINGLIAPVQAAPDTNQNMPAEPLPNTGQAASPQNPAQPGILSTLPNLAASNTPKPQPLSLTGIMGSGAGGMLRAVTPQFQLPRTAFNKVVKPMWQGLKGSNTSNVNVGAPGPKPSTMPQVGGQPK